MQLSRFIQALVLMLMVAMAASCTISKDYTAKIFAPRNTVAKDTAVVTTPRFLNIDGGNTDSTGMVSAEVYKLNDTLSAVTMKEIIPAKTDSIQKSETREKDAGVRIVRTGETRNKRKRE